MLCLAPSLFGSTSRQEYASGVGGAWIAAWPASAARGANVAATCDAMPQGFGWPGNRPEATDLRKVSLHLFQDISQLFYNICATIYVEEISPKSVRSGRLLERDRAGFILCQELIYTV